MQEINPIILGAIALLLVSEGVLVFFVFKTNKRITQFFAGNDAKSIEEVLAYEFRRMKKTEEDTRQLIQNMKWIEGITRKSISKVAVKRFNPFKDLGGNQSFALALLDSANTGVIVSSLCSRDGVRVYAKSVVLGKANHDLTEEEKEVMAKAIGL